MSIFPKRNLPGKSVTIHWSIGLESQGNVPMLPFFQLGVKSPDGHVTYLCQQNILLLPENQGKQMDINNGGNESETVQKHLSRNTPLLILADYLSGKRKKEQLVEILKRIRSSRHFYFTYQIPENAPLGKYELVSELYLDGTCYKSLTAEEDFFYVEKLTVTSNQDGTYSVTNLSPEHCPIKVIEYHETDVSSKIYNIPPSSSHTVEVKSEIAYLLYNEERESVALRTTEDRKILRNQMLQNFEKTEDGSTKVYVISPDEDDAYILDGNYVTIWKLADGTTAEDKLKSIDEETYLSMLKANILYGI